MKRTEQSVLSACLLATAMTVAGCSSTGVSAGSDMAATQGGGLGAVNSTSDSGTAASADNYSSYGNSTGANTGSGTATEPSSPAQASTSATPTTPNSTVTRIEVSQREPGIATSESTAIGSTGTGATGSGATGDRIYRITLRMDDGSTQVVTQEWAPSFSTGDRVRTVSGAIQQR